MPIIVLTLIFLVLTALLWYERPPAGIWLLGSIALALGWGAGFLKLIMNEPGKKIR